MFSSIVRHLKLTVTNDIDELLLELNRLSSKKIKPTTNIGVQNPIYAIFLAYKELGIDIKLKNNDEWKEFFLHIINPDIIKRITHIGNDLIKLTNEIKDDNFKIDEVYKSSTFKDIIKVTNRYTKIELNIYQKKLKKYIMEKIFKDKFEVKYLTIIPIGHPIKRSNFLEMPGFIIMLSEDALELTKKKELSKKELNTLKLLLPHITSSYFSKLTLIPNLYIVGKTMLEWKKLVVIPDIKTIENIVKITKKYTEEKLKLIPELEKLMEESEVLSNLISKRSIWDDIENFISAFKPMSNDNFYRNLINYYEFNLESNVKSLRYIIRDNFERKK